MDWVNKSWLVLDWWLFISEHEIRIIFQLLGMNCQEISNHFFQFFSIISRFLLCLLGFHFWADWARKSRLVSNGRAFITVHITSMICWFSFMHCQDKGTSLNFSILPFLQKKSFSWIIKKGLFKPKIFVVEHRDHFFLVFSRNFWSKTPLFHEKKNYFYFFPVNQTFHPFSHHNPPTSHIWMKSVIPNAKIMTTVG